jgi:hypothetical protein
MKTYMTDLITKFQRFSEKLDNLTLLTNQHWVLLDELGSSKNVYIFRENNVLLISHNGKVEKANWEYLGNNSLLIDRKNEIYLFRHGFFDENVLALKIDGKNEYSFFINETNFNKELNSLENIIEFLNNKYIKSSVKTNIQNSTGIMLENGEHSYKSPKYRIINKIQENSLLSKRTKYFIQFEDGEKGTIYVSKNNKAYFKRRPKDNLISLKYTYIDFETCITALHYFIKNGKELKSGLISIY